MERMKGEVGLEPLDTPDGIARSWWMQPRGKDGIIARWDSVYQENGKEKRRTEGVRVENIHDVIIKYDREARRYFPHG